LQLAQKFDKKIFPVIIKMYHISEGKMICIKKKYRLAWWLIAFFVGNVLMVFPEHFIADYSMAKESVLRSIPVSAIDAAKAKLHILYCGTSHSSQTMDGMRGLMEYKNGDNTLFAFSYNGVPTAGKLDIHYNGTTGSDLSNDGIGSNGHTGYFNGTVSYLDNPTNSDVNVVMWSWCAIAGHDVQIYLSEFEQLINMYKAGGSKGRTVENEVKFVFMTGYASGTSGDTPEPPYIKSPYQNYKRIIDYCNANHHFCLDYWSQDVYHYETDFYKPLESGNDNIMHKQYFDTHTEGVDWFATRSYSAGTVKWPAHCENTPQHITSNRRAYAAWWIWARLAGWSGTTTSNDQLAGSWSGKGMWTYDHFSKTWQKFSQSQADVIRTGNLNGTSPWDMAIWIKSSQALWFRFDNTNQWEKQQLAADQLIDFALGDINHDGKDDLVGSFTTGLWVRDTETKTWQRLSLQIAEKLVCGDFNGDGCPDILAVFAADIWIRYSQTGVWEKQAMNRPNLITLTAADINNDGITDVLGSWDFGIYWQNRTNLVWTKITANPAQILTAGDLDNDSAIDLIGSWDSLGVWLQQSSDSSWKRISAQPATTLAIGSSK
jgi:hypothetical protein